jgi:hypothetical protein
MRYYIDESYKKDVLTKLNYVDLIEGTYDQNILVYSSTTLPDDLTYHYIRISDNVYKKIIKATIEEQVVENEESTEEETNE